MSFLDWRAERPKNSPFCVEQVNLILAVSAVTCQLVQRQFDLLLVLVFNEPAAGIARHFVLADLAACFWVETMRNYHFVKTRSKM